MRPNIILFIQRALEFSGHLTLPDVAIRLASPSCVIFNLRTRRRSTEIQIPLVTISYHDLFDG